jgi:hypothetical protein
LRPCATSQKVAVSIPDVVIGIFFFFFPSGDVVYSACNRNECQEYFFGGVGGGGRWPVRRADILNTFIFWLSWNLGDSTPWNPQTLYRICFTFCLGNHVKWTNIVWAKSRDCNVQHVYLLLLLPLSLRGINARTLY